MFIGVSARLGRNSRYRQLLPFLIRGIYKSVYSPRNRKSAAPRGGITGVRSLWPVQYCAPGAGKSQWNPPMLPREPRHDAGCQLRQHVETRAKPARSVAAIVERQGWTQTGACRPARRSPGIGPPIGYAGAADSAGARSPKLDFTDARQAPAYGRGEPPHAKGRGRHAGPA